jgi:hypothetical protein
MAAKAYMRGLWFEPKKSVPPAYGCSWISSVTIYLSTLSLLSFISQTPNSKKQQWSHFMFRTPESAMHMWDEWRPAFNQMLASMVSCCFADPKPPKTGSMAARLLARLETLLFAYQGCMLESRRYIKSYLSSAPSTLQHLLLLPNSTSSTFMCRGLIVIFSREHVFTAFFQEMASDYPMVF